MSCDDFDPPKLYLEQKRKARKNHTCYECRGLIQKGESYMYYKGLWDGDFCEFKHCLDCSSLIQQAQKKDSECGCFMFGEVESYIYEIERGNKEMPLTDAFRANRERRLELRKQVDGFLKKMEG